MDTSRRVKVRRASAPSQSNACERGTDSRPEQDSEVAGPCPSEAALGRPDDEPGIVQLDAVHHTSLGRLASRRLDTRFAACSLLDDGNRLRWGRTVTGRTSAGFRYGSDEGRRRRGQRCYPACWRAPELARTT